MLFAFIVYAFWRIWLWFTRHRRVDRFVKFVDWNSRDPFKNGLLCGFEESEIEQPKAQVHNSEDVVEFFMQNSKEQILFARISRLGAGLASMTFYVRLGKLGSWRTDQVSVDRSWTDGYAAGGLRFEIIQPKLRWRISFNGVVQDEDYESCHLRAVFVGNFVSGLGDYKVFHDEKFLAEQLAESGLSANVERLNEIDAYVQPFSLSGKVVVDKFEEEMFVWGYRRKQMLVKKDPNVRMKTRITLYTENGIGVDLDEASVEGLSKNLIFGHLAYPTFQQRPIECCSARSLSGVTSLEVGADRNSHLSLRIKSTLDRLSWTESLGRQWMKQEFRIVKVSYDGNVGHGMIVCQENLTPCIIEEPMVSAYVKLHGAEEPKISMRHVLRFEEKICQNEALTGGKGSSLAVLTNISKDHPGKFRVPRGVCVSTRAYREFAQTPAVRAAIDALIRLCGTGPSNEQLRQTCEITTATVASCSLPSDTFACIQRELQQIFGPEASSKQFAVRSSACGEDSEDMSAAGQMETLLGIVGFDNLAKAVPKCWASQFSFVAVQYKRRYGQLIDSDMSVVIQEMVPSEVSGVMFTVDPISANPLRMSITANFGLGESVVSAAADPDTFVVRRELYGSVSIESYQLGQKKLSTTLKDSGGTEDIQQGDRSKERSLHDDQILQLAKVGLLLEENYASARDIEWAFHAGELYMLQSRPVTSADSLDVDFEYLHEADGGLAGEFDSLSKANLGEVLGGSPSTLCQSVFPPMLLKERLDAKKTGSDYGQHPCSRFDIFCFNHSQCFFTTFSVYGNFSGEDMISKGFAISMAGRLIDDFIVVKSNNNKSKYKCTGVRAPGIAALLPTFLKHEKFVQESEYIIRRYKSTIAEIPNLRDMFIATLSEPFLLSETHDAHATIIKYGSFSNVMLLSLLVSAEGDFTTNVFADFALLVSSCNNILSAGVPQSLQKIAHALDMDYGTRFTELEPNEALELVRKEESNSAKLFRKFLEEHGHRSLRELDVASRTWSMNPVPLIETLQSMVRTGSGKLTETSRVTVDKLLDQMRIKLPWLKRLGLKLLLTHVRKGIALRERTKSAMIDGMHRLRLNLRLVAKRMVAEGFLPDEDLIFHMLPDEILRLIDSRNPRLIVRAMNRMRNAIAAAQDIYPEHVACPPFIPTNRKELTPLLPVVGAKFMKGTPVSKGRIFARARVVTRLEDANEIQKGDILITYATDIGWSPYFPLLAGIVTELGGLISHGAVVAREYGLPCVVGCHGATRLFVSDEEVVLDGNTGTISTTSPDNDAQLPTQ